MTTATKPKREPTGLDPEFKYILSCTNEEGGWVQPHRERPTQDWIKNLGAGEYTLHWADGQTIKGFTVDTNQKGNLRLTAFTPVGLPSVSKLNLQRLAALYVKVVRIWIQKSADAKAIQKEIAFREQLISDADDTVYREDDGSADALAQAVEESKAARAANGES